MGQIWKVCVYMVYEQGTSGMLPGECFGGGYPPEKVDGCSHDFWK